MSETTVLHNGIELPEQWPPQRAQITFEPETPPYLQEPPAVIPIDVGRQLFVDDFLIEQTTLKRVSHRPEPCPENPVVRADRPWEHESDGLRKGSATMPFSDGAWYDPADQTFKIWYHADYSKRYMCLATSPDGIHWDKPDLRVVPGTNIVLEQAGSERVVWLDLAATDPNRRFVLVTTLGGEDLIPEGADWWGSHGSLWVHFSPDGIHWSDAGHRRGPTGDRNSAFYDGVRDKWVMSIRAYEPFGGFDNPMRFRRYWETDDLTSNEAWEYGKPTAWVGADRADITREDQNHIRCELYTLDAIAYESLTLGLFTIWRGGSKAGIGRPKPNDLCVGFSRDGFHWHRPDREPFIPISEERGAWNWGNTSSVGGCCLVVGDRLYFYYSGRAGCPDDPSLNSDAGCATGLAFLRRDGFASMEAGETEGTLTTRPLRFSGASLLVNADASAGELRAEVLGEDGEVVEGFSREQCLPMTADSTIQTVQWQDADLASLSGSVVRLGFYLRQGALYAFWVSSDDSGASNGFVAAGGPGFTTSRDTAGAAAYEVAGAD